MIQHLTSIILLLRSAARTLNQIEQHHTQVAPSIHASAQAVLAGLVGTVVSAPFLAQGFTWPIYTLAVLVIAVAHWVDLHLPTTSPSNPPIEVNDHA